MNEPNGVTENEIVDYSADQYHLARHEELLASDELCMAWSHFADYAYFKHVRPGDSVFEFGGGLGNNLFKVAKRAEVCMLEPSELARKFAQDHGIETVVSLDELKQRKFDTVLCRHVLEHVDDPLSTLRSLRSLLKPESTLIVIVPFEQPTLPIIKNEKDFHLYSWNPRTMNNLVRRAGFTEVAIYFEHYGMRRRLLPLFRRGNTLAYAKGVQMTGRLFRFRELVARCKSSES